MDDIDDFVETYYPLIKELNKAEEMGDNELIKEILVKTIDMAKMKRNLELVSYISKIIESYDQTGEFDFNPEPRVPGLIGLSNKARDNYNGSVLTLDTNRQHIDTRKWYNTWPFCNLPEVYNEDTFKIDPNDKDDSITESPHEFLERWKKEHS